MHRRLLPSGCFYPNKKCSQAVISPVAILKPAQINAILLMACRNYNTLKTRCFIPRKKGLLSIFFKEG